jgi:formylglycine-generating enzyme required for sulfatase activity
MSSITRVRRQGLTVALSVSIVVLVGLSVVVGYFLATRSGGDGPAPDPGDNVAVAGSVAAEAAEAVPESNCPPDMTFIRGGSFLMGLDDLESPTSRPPHPVDVSGFCIETREVTDAAFRGCSDIGECKRSFSEPREPDGEPPVAALAELCNARKPGRETHPANCVTWDQARQYCTWKDRVLPSEAQWEFATRGAEGRRHPWGDEKPGEDRVNACGAECRSWRARHGLPTRGSLHLADDGHAATAPVGSFGEGATPEGVQDLAGNVAEWTADRFEPYRGGTSPKGVPPANRVVRGGGFGSERASQVTGFVRDVRNEDGTYVDVGFRCVAKAPS